MIILGALCHDLGKPSTTHVADKDGIPRIRSLGHEEAGVLPTRELLSRLRFGETIEHAAVIAAQDHLKAGMLAREVEKGTLNDEQYVNAVRKLLKRIKPLDWKILLATSEADFRGRGLSNVDIGPYGPGLLFAKTVAEHALDADGVMPLLAGRDLMPYGVKPGPDMGKLLRQVEQWRDDGVVKTPEEAREKLMELLGPPNPFQK
jgi:tRNA nucleotidyltransferase/poly(A) polymerase